MSGVYIKGMEMPKNCHNCPLCLMRCCCANGEELTEKQTRPNAERPQFCPLIPVHDHGRLVEADAVVEQIDEWIDAVGYATVGKGMSYYGELLGCIEDAPTIIPADKEDE